MVMSCVHTGAQFNERIRREFKRVQCDSKGSSTDRTGIG